MAISAAASSAIGYGSGLIGSLANIFTTKKRQQFQTDAENRQFEHNKQMAQYQYSKDLEMWNRGNEYNSPQAQMARLKAAGLNPNLVYGTGTVTGNTTGQLPKYQAPQAKYNPLPVADGATMIQNFQNLRQQQAQTENIKSQTDLTSANATNQKANTAYIVARAKKEGIHLDILDKTQGYQVNAAKSTADKIEAQVQNEVQRLENLKAQKKISAAELKRLNKLNEWLEDGILPSDSLFMRTLQGNWKKAKKAVNLNPSLKMLVPNLNF